MRRKDDDPEPAESPERWKPGGIQVVRWPAEGAAKGSTEYAATYGHTLVAGDMLVSRRAHGHTVKQGGIADKLLFVLDRSVFLSWALFYFQEGELLWQIPREDSASTADSTCRKF